LNTFLLVSAKLLKTEVSVLGGQLLGIDRPFLSVSWSVGLCLVRVFLSSSALTSALDNSAFLGSYLSYGRVQNEKPG